jgi:hypothetical protein
MFTGDFTWESGRETNRSIPFVGINGSAFRFLAAKFGHANGCAKEYKSHASGQSGIRA